MRIVHIAAEMAPVAKLGGLADVLLGLCRELSNRGHDVDIILPKYDCMDSDQVRDLAIENLDMPSFFDGELFHNTIWSGWVENLKVYFIEPHHPHELFKRGCFYGCHDDIDRYLYFCRAAIEFIFKKQIRPSIIHIHDWQTASIAPLYRDIYMGFGMHPTKIVYTIHNLEYQGLCSIENFTKIGLDGQRYAVFDKLQDPIHNGLLNLMKGGMVYADYITTVSPTYAEEILTPKDGRNLDGVLRYYKDKFCGVLNGIDNIYWNPESDKYLPTHYSQREIPKDKNDHNILDKKGFVKKSLRDVLGLTEKHAPIVAFIARLVPQKGINLIRQAIQFILSQGGQFVLLGTSPIPAISEEFHKIHDMYRDHPDVSIILHHDEKLAHEIYAGSDIFFMPSLFEPCGLAQLIALRYGTIPVVRKTGGLADTVFDITDETLPPAQRNGFLFEEPSETAVYAVLERALTYWFEQPQPWRLLMIRGMNCNFSWSVPAGKYLEIYQLLAARA
jgi:starch synthase